VAWQYDRATEPSKKVDKTMSRRKSKIVSILLAVFLGFWTWLYTYGIDTWKFWTSIVVYSVLSVIVFINWQDNNLRVVIIAFMFLVWALTVIDTVFRQSEWYDKYPNGKE
jgi:chromate transport protein ChrA